MSSSTPYRPSSSPSPTRQGGLNASPPRNVPVARQEVRRGSGFSINSPPSLSHSAMSPSFYTVVGSPIGLVTPDRRFSAGSALNPARLAAGKVFAPPKERKESVSSDVTAPPMMLFNSPIHPTGFKQAFQMGINPGTVDGVVSPAYNGFSPFAAPSPAEPLWAVMRDGGGMKPVVTAPPSPTEANKELGANPPAQGVATKKG